MSRSKVLQPFLMFCLLKIVLVLVQEPANKQIAPQADTIKINTSLVTVPVIVKDGNGHFVTGLTKDDFAIEEDDSVQKITNFSYTEEPVTIALIFDTSPSTKDWLSTLRKYATVFIKQLRSQDQVALITFDERVHFLGAFTRDHRVLTYQVNAMKSGIATAFYDGISLTITEKFATIKGRKALIVFTDGRDSWSHKATADSTLALVTNAGIPCYVIQYWTDPATAQYLNTLATSSGALHLPIENIKNADSAFAVIADELHHQYTLGYYSSNEQRDGRYRQIAVRVKRKDVILRARQGYRVAKD